VYRRIVVICKIGWCGMGAGAEIQARGCGVLASDRHGPYIVILKMVSCRDCEMRKTHTLANGVHTAHALFDAIHPQHTIHQQPYHISCQTQIARLVPVDLF
jgi:hypothetical protein